MTNESRKERLRRLKKSLPIAVAKVSKIKAEIRDGVELDRRVEEHEKAIELLKSCHTVKEHTEKRRTQFAEEKETFSPPSL